MSNHLAQAVHLPAQHAKPAGVAPLGLRRRMRWILLRWWVRQCRHAQRPGRFVPRY